MFTYCERLGFSLAELETKRSDMKPGRQPLAREVVDAGDLRLLRRVILDVRQVVVAFRHADLRTWLIAPSLAKTNGLIRVTSLWNASTIRSGRMRRWS